MSNKKCKLGKRTTFLLFPRALLFREGEEIFLNDKNNHLIMLFFLLEKKYAVLSTIFSQASFFKSFSNE